MLPYQRINCTPAEEKVQITPMENYKFDREYHENKYQQ